ncbi:4'-phosphopantetheinyl transferase family protein [Clostridium kluyveri]|uniref:Predicted phosphopantetheinyl transferase n=2 Tax=Clostridium kluyveri TaxID=1534 RepID=A5N8D4_CLOK5|nr:4'-phosphopantetheinyl transferase superfamily protein [Clostridium kluyveri]EDK33565.1 Predicted phosphopantetheinyl transferase [Clostridium kluyveri DSM 555]
MVNIYAINLSGNMNCYELDELMSFISEEKLYRVKKFHRLEDLKRGVMSEILVRFILCKDFHVRNKDLSITKNYYGKPLLSYPESIHFNVSHSGYWIVCAVHNLPVGIDIEQIKPIDFSIAEHFFSESEYESILTSDEGPRLPLFYEFWTLKESYIKAVGKGLYMALNSFNIKLCNDDIQVEREGSFEDYYFKQYDIDKNYKLSVCARTNNFSDSIILWSDLELYKMFKTLVR